MSTGNELITARKLTRLKFIEQALEQLWTYKCDLEFCLVNTKKLLSEILSTDIKTNHRILDSSGDTEFSNHITLKTLELAQEKNLALLSKYKKTKAERDIILGKVLITEQLAEESLRKEHEIINECEEQTNDIKYVLDKKDARINHLKIKIDSIESQLSKMKGESMILLTLSETNLDFFIQGEKVKKNLSKMSKNLQITELQTEELVKHYENLASVLSKYKIFLKNPMIRNKKNIFLGSAQALDMSVNYESENSDSSSSEACFPDVLQIEARIKPSLPKLDFTKVIKTSNSQENEKVEIYAQFKSKSDFLGNYVKKLMNS